MNIAEHLDKKQTRVIAALGAACVAALVALIVILVVSGRDRGTTGARGEFTPPTFEPAAVSGMPEVDDEAWAELPVRDHYVIRVCGELHTDADGNARVWFYSDKGNEVWVKLRICDAENYIIGETGILKPGEYVETVALKRVPEDGSDVVMYVMGYEPETYYSAGSVTLATTVSSAD